MGWIVQQAHGSLQFDDPRVQVLVLTRERGGEERKGECS